jgi:cytochrome oxidase Cu insertion factor (SCO1/SenC/PrrC family)
MAENPACHARFSAEHVPTERSGMVEEGKPAPDFELESDSGDRVRLSSLRGRPVVLHF